MRARYPARMFDFVPISTAPPARGAIRAATCPKWHIQPMLHLHHHLREYVRLQHFSHAFHETTHGISPFCSFRNKTNKKRKFLLTES
jgi:hypothetical protein